VCSRPLDSAAGWSIAFRVRGQFQRLTPKQRAEHVAALSTLGRLVIALPYDRLQWRRFVVMSAGEPPSA